MLVALAGRLRALLRPMDTVARFGGDEFTFLFEDLADEREVVLIAERISRAAGLPVKLEDREVDVTVSIGIAMVADPSIPRETVIREADAAVYRAKELGRSRYALSDEASRLRAMERLELETALRHAVERSELRVHYQPKVALDCTHQVIGFERAGIRYVVGMPAGRYARSAKPAPLTVRISGGSPSFRRSRVT